MQFTYFLYYDASESLLLMFVFQFDKSRSLTSDMFW